MRSIAILVVVLASGLACAGEDSVPGGGDSCKVGEEGCSCTPGGGCDLGLECEDGVCVPADGTGTTTDSSGSTGPTHGETTTGTGGSASHGSESTNTTGTGTTTGGTGAGTSGSTDASSSATGTGTPTDTSSTATTATTATTAGGVPANIVFVTSTSHVAGDLGGLAGADAICNQLAADAGLPGTYVAWLSDATADAVDRLGSARGWVRTDGWPFVDTVADLLAWKTYYPVIYDENVDTVALQTRVLTATESDGQGSDTTGLYCGNWTDPNDATTVFPAGRIGGGNRFWTEYVGAVCSDSGHLFCFGIDHQHELVFVPESGRLAFTSRGTLAADAGRDAADAQCQAVAEAAGYTGTFLAAMAIPGEAAKDRFDLGGEPWVRVDGVRLFPANNPMGRVMYAPMLYDADGSMLSYPLVWAGAEQVDIAGDAASTCNGWTEVTGESRMGTSWDMAWWNWNVTGTEECSMSVGVFCFEN